MRKRHVVVLSEAERARLHTMIGRGVAPASALTHARILLKANQGEAGSSWTDAAIGAALEVNPATVARVRMRYVAAGLDAAVYRTRTRATVAGLTSSAAPMAASVQPGPASPWLAFNRMRAWVRALAGATPRPIMVCSRARSASDRTTTCRLRTSASYGGGLPGPHEHETEPPTLTSHD